jgi:hypothetical protein
LKQPSQKKREIRYDLREISPVKLDVDNCYSERFDGLRSAIYHSWRERWFAGSHRFVMFITALFGTSSAVFILGEFDSKWGVIVAVIASALTMVDLVFDLPGRALLHAVLKERFYQALADCEADTEGQSHLHRAKLTRIYGAEPPYLHALNELAWNKTYIAMSHSQNLDELKKVSFICRITGNFISWDGCDFSSKKDSAPNLSKKDS